MRTIHRMLGVLAALATLSGGPVLAQGLQTGIINGTITTSDGLSLPGATVTVESPGDVNFLVPASSIATTIPAAALAVASESALTAAGVGEGTVDLRVVAFDLSGNMAMSSDKLSTFVPSEAAGCSSVLAAPGLGALALVAMLRRRRRS